MPAKRSLRAWGAEGNLDVKKMFRMEVTTKKVAKFQSWVYVVEGHRPEPLLGDNDAHTTIKAQSAPPFPAKSTQAEGSSLELMQRRRP